MAGSVIDEEEEAAGGHADADPLAGADLEAEQPLGHHGEDHDAGGEHGLDDGERGEGEGGDVEDQALVATAMPIANHLEEKRLLTVRSGWRTSTFGASLAPLCLYRKPSCVTTAHKSASNMPRFITSLGSRSAARRGD